MIRILFLVLLFGYEVSSIDSDRNLPYRNLYMDHKTGKGYIKDEYLKPRQSDSRIHYGDYAEDHEFPWVVDMTSVGYKEHEDYPFTSETHWICVATVIDEGWVMTAAHCLANATGTRLIFGVTDFCEENENATEMYINDTSRFHFHPEFDLEWLLNDIALIELPYTLNLDGTYIDKAYLPSENGELYSIDDEVEVVGWGTDESYDDSYACNLEKMLVTVMGSFECYKYFVDDLRFNDGTICTTYGICKGDTGGPLNSYTTASQTVYGVVSFYFHDNCQYYPVGYAWVRYYLDWIKDVSGVRPPPGQGCGRDTLTKLIKKTRGYTMKQNY